MIARAARPLDVHSGVCVMRIEKTIAFIGAGSMAEAMIRGLLRGKVFTPEQITASGPLEEHIAEIHERYGVQTTTNNRSAAGAQIVVLSVKPQILSRVLEEISDAMNPDALVISIAAGLIPYLACWKLKSAAGYDDALDTFGVHAVGGTLGALLTGFLASAAANPNLTGDAAKANGLAKLVTDGGLWVVQLKAIGITLCLAVVGTTIIAYLVRAIVGLRVSTEVEVSGLDLAEHGEEGYHTAGQ